MDKYIGRLLDNRYEILEVLGTGGMAVVYKARCHRLNRLVAIKILRDDFSQDEEFRRRFQAESQAVAMLSHPNIVSVHDVSTSDGADYIVMELIDGITLKQYMEKKGVLNWKETLHFAIQIGKALEHAHSRGIIHRDIKPHNVMVLKNGSVKVTDFGIARVMSKSNTLTKEALGSVHYISPEQAKGGRVDNRSDIYSLGVVMYEMMTGRPPYDGESPVSVAIQHINGQAAMPSTLNPNIPGGLEQIIMKAMAQESAKRYDTATAMLADMDEFRKDPTILFDYNNTSTSLDDAAMLQSNAHAEEAPVQQKTTAERVAGRTDLAAKRSTPPHRSGSSGKKPRRRKEEIIEEDEKSSKVATIAIVACSVVLVLAIVIIFIIAFGSGREETNLVMVPNLVGKTVTYAESQKDISIKVIPGGYSDIYAKDEIIEQNPVANTQIEKGGEVTITVSLGVEPKVKTMEKLVEWDETTAKNFLTNAQGIDPTLIVILEEASATVKKGYVIKTEPVEGAELVEGEPIKLWVSSGPATKTAKMPNLIGHNVDTAKELLTQTGFTVVAVEQVESNQTANTVIWQSIPAEMDVDVKTPIVLQIPLENTPVITPPTNSATEPVDYVSKRITLELPDDMTGTYVLSVRREGVVVEERNIPADAVSIEIELSGKGVMDFEIWIGNTYGWSEQVDFGANG